MQPIAVNISVVQDLLSDWSDYKKHLEFHKMVENLKEFHVLSIDKINDDSLWLNEFKNFRNSIKNGDLLKMVDELLGPKNLKYEIFKLNKADDYFFELANSTPDKIALHTSKGRKENVKFYDLATFNSSKYDLQNFLFRIPKHIKLKPGFTIKDFRIFAPYLRGAKSLEFCDPYLFIAKKRDGEIYFIKKLIELSGAIKKVVFHCELNQLNLNHKFIEKEIKNNFAQNISCEFKNYNKSKNHDRFIIIDQTRYSIRFTTSFNNFSLTNGCSLIAKRALEISFNQDREYFDY